MSEVAATSVTPTATPVSAPPPGVEPVILSGGESPASWDELESVTAKPKAETKPKPESKEKKAPEGDEKPKKETVKDDKQSSGKDTKDGEQLEKAAQPVKMLKLKSGESEVELASDTKVPVKVEGKTVEVTLQEAINRYSQQSHLDKLYKTYKGEKEAFEQERKRINGALEKSHDLLVKQKDLRGFLEYFGEAMGMDADELIQGTLGKLQSEVEELQQLTPEERRIRELDRELSRFKSRKEAEKQQAEKAKSRAAIESQMKTVMEKHGLDQAAVVKAWDDLTSLGHKPDDITPEFIGAYTVNMRRIETIESKLKEINPELGGNPEVVEQLAKYAIQTDATEAEIAEAIAQLYGDTPEKKLTKKIEKNMKANSQKGSKAQKNPGSDPLFFDDI